LEQALPQTLEQVRSARQLIVYYSGAAFADETGVIYLAPRECSLSRLTTTCIPLKWLIDRLEASPVPKKLLLLDVCRGTIGVAGGKQPSTAEMIETIRGTRKSPGLKTLDVIASCSAKERGRELKDQQHGAFAYYIAQGYSGAGDKNRDLILDTTEIADYLKKSLADAGAQLGGSQTPVLFQPDTTPLRISKEAKDEIEKLALALGQPQIDFAAATQVYEKTQTLAPKQPEPKVLYAIAMYRALFRGNWRPGLILKRTIVRQVLSN
jgi:hypothetical protein